MGALKNFALGKIKHNSVSVACALALLTCIDMTPYFFDSKNDQEVEKKISTDQNFGKDDQNKI